jgi:K+-transporting ATPase KdpF subunit
MRFIDKGSKGRMSLETILAAACSVLLLIYLVYALLRPEKF